MWRAFLRSLGELLYPPVCLACETLLPPDGRMDFCATCHTALTHDPYSTCPRCSSTIGPYTDVSHGCPACRNDTFAFDAAIRLGPYEGVLRETILRIKFGAAESLADSLGRLWAEAMEHRFRELQPDVIVPVPLHWLRRLRRGFNQAAVLAAGLAARLHLPHQPYALRRIRSCPPQTTRTVAQRRANVKGIFALSPHAKIQEKTILLIDDVLTTGSTCHEAAQVLKRGGARKVIAAVLAHD